MQTNPATTSASEAPDNQTPAILPVINLPGLSSRRRNGKIAKLPKELRDLVNNMLLDGHTGAEIIQKLGERGVSLNHENISNWNQGGHQDWLNERAWREELSLRRDSFTELLTGADPVQLPEAGLQIAAMGVCDLLRSLSQPGAEPDPDKYVRVANSLARLSRSILQLQEYRDEQNKAKAAELKRRDPKAKGTEKEQDILITGWKDFFGHDLTEHEADAAPLQLPGSVEAIAKNAQPCNADVPVCELGERPRSPSDPLPATATPIVPPPVSENAQPSIATQGPSETGQQATSVVQSSTASKYPAEHCLECGALLPSRLPNGNRPSETCRNCGIPLPTCLCTQPSLENCPQCKAKLPRPHAGGRRRSPYCHRCGTALPAPAKEVLELLKAEAAEKA